MHSAVSLIIAAYNRGPRIARTLDSALGQTLPPAEVVVVDDCSSDDTGQWVRAHYPQVRVLRPESNLYTSGARNFGAARAVGDILIFLDHDDELMPHALETLVALLRDHPEARAAYADHVYSNTAAGIYFPDHHFTQPGFARLRSVRAMRATQTGRVYGQAMYYALLRGNLLQQPWAIYRDAFLNVGGFAENVRYCEDWDLYLRLAQRFPLALSDRVIAYHHVEGENLHLAAGQEQMHMRVLRRQLSQAGWLRPRAHCIIRQRLAMYHKSAGDQARRGSLLEAWRHYLRSLWTWPLDPVVGLRALWWPWCMLLGSNRAQQGVHR